MKKKSLIIMLTATILLLLVGTVRAEILDNDVEVEPNSELIYYLDITCDGVDKYGTDSNEEASAEIKSGYIYVEDKIPDGLEFDSFVTTTNGTIGAVLRDNSSQSCSGSVVDDTKDESKTEGKWNNDNTEYTYHGLHYTTSDRTVRFKVKNLKAGGVLTVGIKTKTPETVDNPATAIEELRRDFYNFATAVEDALSVVSNTVHVFMGKADATLYTVTYEYEGELPENLPSLSSDMKYAENTSVGVASNINVEGYTFNGWITSDATIQNDSFIMPAKDVVLKGSFTKENKYKVTYKIDGESPEDYILPTEKQYYKNKTVTVDTLSKGDIIDGYKFSGWTTEDVTISEDNDFVMEAKNVTIQGSFEQIKYKVEYKFYDTLVPPNSDSLLPETKEYAPGEKVTLETVNDVEGYKFLGWYEDDTFKMPEEDVVIYGEWMKVDGTFEPKIEIEVVDKKTSYKVGDTVEFKITVTNQNDFDIKEVIIKEMIENMEFKVGEGYKKESANFATIDTIPANGKAYLYATYKVTSDDEGALTNEVQILGALADNKYILLDKEYKDTCDFKVKKDSKSNNNDKKGETKDSKDDISKEEGKNTTNETTNSPTTTIKENGATTDTTDKEATVTITYDNDNKESITEKNTTKNAKTGDKIIMYIATLTIATTSFIAIKKRKNKKGEK